MAPDILQHASLPFPTSLPEFQRLFPDDTACAAYLEKIRWEYGFTCPHCDTVGEPVVEEPSRLLIVCHDPLLTR